MGVIPVILSPIIGRFAHSSDMRRLVTFSFIMYAVCFYWRAWTFEPGMDFGASAWPQFIQGFAVACFFMPLTTITLSGLPPERLAAASSLSNFTRTLAGSIGTSITTTLWTNREALHHAQLTESVTPFNPNAQQIYDQLQGMGMTQQAGVRLDSAADNQPGADYLRQRNLLDFCGYFHPAVGGWCGSPDHRSAPAEAAAARTKPHIKGPPGPFFTASGCPVLASFCLVCESPSPCARAG
ncbi:multidrug resistance protein B [Klebsiella pneumoniae]|uniref:Multidrug resistance protein B n=1 Tax=Klebsiella pneumoniae TaxID=573 RepID=A0A378AC65_KLEPN|nr:multidrug resistance protein B [Klebsiella pneumoniae]